MERFKDFHSVNYECELGTKVILQCFNFVNHCQTSYRLLNFVSNFGSLMWQMNRSLLFEQRAQFSGFAITGCVVLFLAWQITLLVL